MAKRKRNAFLPERNCGTPPSSTDGGEGLKHITVAEHPFEVEVIPSSGALKGPKDQANWTGPDTQTAVVPNGIKCTYRISPANQWKKMRKYSKFIVGQKSFGVGDYVYIYHGDQLHGAQLDPALTANWVAQVLEVRAADSYHVYLRLFWMYWPDELPGGRENYHGAYELIASNHMEIVDAMTVTDKADVLQLKDDSPTPTRDLYWRQTFDFLTNKLSNLRRDCYCNQYHQPERLLIQCPHCDKYLHEACLLRDACNRAWLQERNKVKGLGTGQRFQHEPLPNRSTTSTKMPHDQNSNTNNPITSTLPPPPPPIPQRRLSHSQIKRRKSLSTARPDPWDYRMKAFLEMKQSEAGEETSEATGMATVCHNLVDNQASQNIQIGLRCLFSSCGRWLYDEPDSQQADCDNGEVELNEQKTIESDNEDRNCHIEEKNTVQPEDQYVLPTPPQTCSPAPDLGIDELDVKDVSVNLLPHGMDIQLHNIAVAVRI